MISARLFGLLRSTEITAIMRLILFGLLTSIGISTTIGLIWSIAYLLYSPNFQTTPKVFFFSLFGGVLSAIVSLFISYLIGKISAKKANNGFFIGGNAFALVLWIIIF
jgi:hypothetical protein